MESMSVGRGGEDDAVPSREVSLMPTPDGQWTTIPTQKVGRGLD